jgi:hypothetical protein
VTSLNSKKVVCSIGYGPHEELLAIVGPALKDYARRHCYDVVLESRLLDKGRPAAWSKVLLLQRLMDQYQAAVWIDSDAIIVEPSLDILDELPDTKDLGMVAHCTVEGPEIPNTGVLAIRSTPETRDFLQRIWQHQAFINHKWWDNAAALSLLGYTTDAPVRRISSSRYQRLVHFLDEGWNSLPAAPSKNPRIIHFAGEDHRARVIGLQDLAGRISNRSPV